MRPRSGSQDLDIVGPRTDYRGPRDTPVESKELGLILNCDCDQKRIRQLIRAS